MRLYIIILFLCAVAFNSSAQCTTRKNLKLIDNHAVTIAGDTIKDIGPNLLKITGYDKPLYSNKETFFATNNGTSTINAINITFNYFDRQNRQLHSVSHTIECSIPPGETRQLSVSSWDKQNSFYYYRSAKPRRQATPYMVSHSINFAVLHQSQELLQR